MFAAPTVFRLALLGLLLGGLAPAEASTEQKKVIIDFEDVGTWRTMTQTGVKPGAWWPADLGLSGSSASKYRDEYVGEIRFAFDPTKKGPYSLSFDRQKMTLVSGFLSAIEFEADARNFPVSLRFEFQDAATKVFRTKPIALSGDGWQHYRLDLNAETVPDFAKCKFPANLKRIILEASEGVTGSVFIDDVTLTGTFTKKDQITVLPIYEGIYYLPEKDVTLKYRLRNANAAALEGSLQMEVRDFSGLQVATREVPVVLPAHGSTEASIDLGRLPIGAYTVELKAVAGGFETKASDTFGVFVPNNGQPNQHQMWFGVGDQTSWQGAAENERHWEWMKLLGADINRMELFPDRYESEQGLIAAEGWGKLIEGQGKAGVRVMVLYSGTPEWTQTKPLWRGPADIFDKYEQHARDLGTFLEKYPNVYSLEYWNEPDLEFFNGEFDEYLTMFRHFSKGLKETFPEVKILSGGVTVQHPREKKGFSKDMFQKAADLYEIAAYHAHGPVNNNDKNHRMVEAWLNEAGLNKPFTNTETGDRSLYDVPGRYRQAITLVKKVVHAKSIPNFDAYFWFTLQDYWDMDAAADDSFGLITSDNRVKPSFIAYNTLIRQLANTTPVKDGLSAPGLNVQAFRKDDGRFVYTVWPQESKGNGILWLKNAGNVEVTDMFGKTLDLKPLGQILPVAFDDKPLYLTMRNPEERIELCAPEEEFVKLSTEIGTLGGEPVSVPVALRNPTRETLEGTLTLRKSSGEETARQAFKIAPGAEFFWKATIQPEKGASYDAQTYALDIRIAGETDPSFSFPVRMIGTYLIKKVAALSDDPAQWPSLDDATPITLDQPEQVIELTYDPLIPAWKGVSDLSAVARIAHDGKGIRFQIAVKDDVAGPAQPKARMFLGDDVQVAFAAPNAKKFAVLDLGQSAEGPTVWCAENPNARHEGEWKVPFLLTKKGNLSIYDAYLPFEMLDLDVTKTPQPVRFTFMVNENDGKGRVRWIQWKEGIGRNRSLDMLGHGMLE